MAGFLLLALLAQQTPLSIGETFTIASKVLGETRRINVYRPTPYGLAADAPLPVLYMPDGGIGEDFLHVAGLLQVSTGNGTMRPFLLVGIENTERRRDMADQSAPFRTFIRTELMPAIAARYRTTNEKAIVGESLAGLFVVETLLVEPALFDTYIAFDPSLWWNDGKLVAGAAGALRATAMRNKRVYIATSGDGDRGDFAKTFASMLETRAGLAWTYEPMPGETHATIYHPAALRAFRLLFKPEPARD